MTCVRENDYELGADLVMGKLAQVMSRLDPVYHDLLLGLCVYRLLKRQHVLGLIQNELSECVQALCDGASVPMEVLQDDYYCLLHVVIPLLNEAARKKKVRFHEYVDTVLIKVVREGELDDAHLPHDETEDVPHYEMDELDREFYTPYM
jgi:hypothetical protein